MPEVLNNITITWAQIDDLILQLMSSHLIFLPKESF